MANVQDIVERYLSAFNETDPGRRRELVNELYGAESTYVDPHVELRGPEQLERFIAETQERFPGYTFRLGGPVDAHHSQARFQWHAGPANGAETQFVGFDVIVTDGERLRSVYGFMDAAPAS
jgi:SnoaL-like domain